MTLLRLIVEHDGRRRELEVDVDSEATGRAIYDAVAPKLGVAADEYGLVVARSSEAIHPGARLNHYALRNAELVQVVPNHPGGPAPEDAPWQLKVVAGPAVGGVLSIRAGTLTLGRETDAGRYLRDDAISRSHVTISAASNQLTIADAGSTNGTYVNNGRINSAVSLREGDYVGLGETLLEVMQAKREVLPGHLTYDSGSLLFNRPPRVASEAPAAAYEIESAPETAPKQRVPLAASLIPVVLGLSTFVIVGLMSAENGGFKAQPQLLLMTLAGPLMAIVTYSSNKRSGRGDFEERRTKYLSSLEAIRKQASAARDRAVEWRHRRHLRSEVVVHSAVNLDASLWSRRPADDDFLELRLGTVDQPSLVQISNRGGGAPELAKTAADLTASMVLDKDVPIAISARDSGVVGLVGTSEQLDELARWWAVQIAAHHSPREVALAVIAPGAEASWDWAKWLPHSNVMASNRVTMATDDEEAETLFRMLRSVAKERLSAREGLIGSSGATHLPHVLLVVQPPLRMPAREMAEFLEQAPQAGMSVVWLAETRSALPGACQAIVELHGSGVTLTRSSGETVSSIRPDRVGLGDAARVGLSLAPLRDVAEAAADGGIPNRINLVDLIHPSPLAAQNVAAAWQRAPDSLSAVLGMGEGRPVFVDMIADGPHGLLGGTTGAGKSELLQTLIASLAVTYSPNRVNFVLVDYKGGAAFKDCVDLPHAVGFVTDLDGRLAERAIVSLDAELKSREHVLAAGGFKDVAEMRKRNPAEAPANLIIVVDEFAALKTEVPEFVDGVVDIAQRGRSLGVHLLLATQKPGGIISANIQANTNLRIALRVTDAGESSDIIGRPDAAKLSRHLPGRAYVRTGSSEVATVQVAYVGGSGTAEVVQAPARTFRITPAAAAKARTVGADGPSHLSGMVAAAADAARQLGVGEQKRPWLPELGELVPIEAIGATVPGLVAPSCSIGLLDDAANQAQDPYVLDLESAGSAAVFGVSGSGKTTALRTIAASVANTYSTREAQIYGLDFAGRGLGGINVLPHVGDVVFGDDLERVRRLIVVLAERSSQRRKKFGDVGASSAAEYRRITSDLMPAIVVLIDGFAQLWSTLEPIDRGVHAETLARVISDGRGAGMHFVITADRRAALPPILSSTIPTRLLLKLANADEYSSLGMRAPEGFEKVPAGRCWAPGGEVQLAALSLGEETDGSAQTRALAEVASSLPAPDPGTAPDPIQLLPELVALEDLPPPAAGSMSLPIGIDEVTLDPVVIDCAAKPLFLAVGPSGSGRTTVLRTLTRSHHHAVPSGEAYLLGGRRSALFDDPWWQETARGADEAEQLTRRLCSLIAEREADPTAPPMLVVIDDADDFADGLVATAIEELLSRSRDGRVTVLAAMTTFKAERSYTNWVQMIRGERHGIILQPDEETSGDVLSSRLPRRAGLVTMPGRGYLVIGGSVGLIQVAS